MKEKINNIKKYVIGGLVGATVSAAAFLATHYDTPDKYIDIHGGRPARIILEEKGINSTPHTRLGQGTEDSFLLYSLNYSPGKIFYRSLHNGVTGPETELISLPGPIPTMIGSNDGSKLSYIYSDKTGSHVCLANIERNGDNLKISGKPVETMLLGPDACPRFYGAIPENRMDEIKIGKDNSITVLPYGLLYTDEGMGDRKSVV
jgi:hypothetical protein